MSSGDASSPTFPMRLATTPYHNGKAAALLVRCDDMFGGLVRRNKSWSTFRFYDRHPELRLTAAVVTRGWRKSMRRELASNVAERGWEAASHTRTHQSLTEISDSQLKDELARSKADLESMLRTEQPDSHPITVVYPNGDEDERVRRAVAHCGYAVGLTYGPKAEGVSAFPPWEDILSWGYTLNAPQYLTADELVARYKQVVSGGGVFAVTTHPPPAFVVRRWFKKNVYEQGGSWDEFLSDAKPFAQCWVTTFGELASYRRACEVLTATWDGQRTVSVRETGSREPFWKVPATFKVDIQDRSLQGIRPAKEAKSLPLLSQDETIPRARSRVHGKNLLLSVTDVGEYHLVPA